MDLLEKLAGNDLASRLEKNAVPQKTVDKKNGSGNRPAAPCPVGHPPPYGRHFWLDAYGSWHCTECCPPATLAQVRDEVLVDVVAPVMSTPDPPADLLTRYIVDHFILAVTDETGDPKTAVFRPGLSQAERRRVMEDLEWWDRADKRRAHQPLEHITGEPEAETVAVPSDPA
jgi:hypothetical protein